MADRPEVVRRGEGARLAAVLAFGLAGLAAGCGTKTVTVEHTVTEVRTVTAPSTTTSPASVPLCAGDALRGTFAVVAGSAGAGQISYRLRVTNIGAADCTVSGLPDVLLLGADGEALPTRVTAAQPGQPTAARVVLAPSGSAVADARFSPDVPGVGDSQSGACQPRASTLRVTAPGGGTVDVPVQPPTAVCEQGSLRLSVYSAAP
jgi:hypothetical protein